MIEPEAITLEPQTIFPTAVLTTGQVEDLHLAVSKMHGAERRAFQAEMTLKYCQGQARQAETLFGWGRHTVEVGLAEKRTGIICLGAQSAFAGSQRWEERYPEAATVLRHVAEAHAQQDPNFRTALAYTRLTAKEAWEQLRERGAAEEHLPSPSAMAQILNRMGYRLRQVVKAKPQKKFRKPMPFSPMSRRKIDMRNPTRSNG
jgi:Rhodopirellula transposase DDE domain